MRWVGNVARMKERLGVYKGKRHLGDASVDGRIILRSVLMKCDVRAGTGSIRLRIRTGGGHL